MNPHEAHPRSDDTAQRVIRRVVLMAVGGISGLTIGLLLCWMVFGVAPWSIFSSLTALGVVASMLAAGSLGGQKVAEDGTGWVSPLASASGPVAPAARDAEIRPIARRAPRLDERVDLRNVPTGRLLVAALAIAASIIVSYLAARYIALDVSGWFRHEPLNPTFGDVFINLFLTGVGIILGGLAWLAVWAVVMTAAWRQTRRYLFTSAVRVIRSGSDDSVEPTTTPDGEHLAVGIESETR